MRCKSLPPAWRNRSREEKHERLVGGFARSTERRPLTFGDRISTAIVALLVPALLIPLVFTVGASPELRVRGEGAAAPGSIITVSAHRFPPRSVGVIDLDGVRLTGYTANAAGTFRLELRLPRNLSAGSHQLRARARDLVVATVFLTVSAALPQPGAASVPPPTRVQSPIPTPAATPVSASATATRVQPADVSPSDESQAPGADETPAPTTTANPTPIATPLPTAPPPPAPVPTVVPPPPPAPPAPPPPPSQNVITFTPSVTQAQLLGAIADNTVDVIALMPGTYPLGGMTVNADRTRPVVIRAQTSGTVVVDGNGADRAFMLGSSGRAANITFEGLIFEDYFIGERGVFTLGNTVNITMRQITIRNTRGVSGYLAWGLYLSSSGGFGPRNTLAEDWTIVGDPAHSFGGFQSGHDPNARTAVLRRWNVSNVTFAIYAASDATDMTFENFNITDSGANHDDGFYSVVIVIPGTGLLRDSCLTRSGGFYVYSPQVVDQRACQTP
jgi:hypothetical protein